MRRGLYVVVALGCLGIIGTEMGAQPGNKGGGGPGGFGGTPFGKKKGGFDEGRGVVVQPGSPVRVRWEYRIEPGGAMSEVKLNSLGAEGWELAAIDVPPVGGRSYIFRRPGVGPPVEAKPAGDAAPKEKAQPQLALRLYPLRSANAHDMAHLISDALAISKMPMRVVAEQRTNTLVVNAPSEAHEQIEVLLNRLDLPGDDEKPKVFKKKNP